MRCSGRHTLHQVTNVRGNKGAHCHKHLDGSIDEVAKGAYGTHNGKAPAEQWRLECGPEVQGRSALLRSHRRSD